MSLALVGSIRAIAQRDNISIAESFLNADAIVLVDVSGSMATKDSRDGLSRYKVACDELARLQAQLPGKVAVIAFSNKPQFAPSGVPFYEGTSTNLTDALSFVKVADGTVTFVVISDGVPNDETSALRLASEFESKIDTVFVGPEGGGGADFLRRLAAASGGKHATATAGVDLSERVSTLLLGSGR